MRPLILSLIVCGLFTFGCGGGSESAGTADSSTATSNHTESASTPDPSPAPAPNIVLTAKLDGAEWKAGPMQISEQFYEKGSSFLRTDDPVLTLVFVAADKPDNRQLLFYIFKFNGKPGKIDPANLEITGSGASTGDFKDGSLTSNEKNGKKQPFNLEITKFDRVSPNEAIVSGTLSGTLLGTLGGKDQVITDGVFTDLKVQVLTEKK